MALSHLCLRLNLSLFLSWLCSAVLRIAESWLGLASGAESGWLLRFCRTTSRDISYVTHLPYCPQQIMYCVSFSDLTTISSLGLDGCCIIWFCIPIWLPLMLPLFIFVFIIFWLLYFSPTYAVCSPLPPFLALVFSSLWDCNLLFCLQLSLPPIHTLSPILIVSPSFSLTHQFVPHPDSYFSLSLWPTTISCLTTHC